eukprot:m.752073 g.752073  ORF g.752073 m.752073 type:complete len:54 (+) comp23168_c0_seq54:308-469(+)
MPPTPPSYSVVAADSSSGNSATATYDMFIAGNKVCVLETLCMCECECGCECVW